MMFVHGSVKNFVPRTSGLLALCWLAKRPSRCSDDCPPLMPWKPYTWGASPCVKQHGRPWGGATVGSALARACSQASKPWA